MQRIGRYALFDEVARGGMAAVHLGKLVGPRGFSRPVAVKRLHAHLGDDPAFVEMLLDEAKMAGRIQHPNVVSMLDVVSADGEVLIVMEYVQGESLQRLIEQGGATRSVPPEIAVAIVADVLRGLDAAHDARNEHGEPMGLIHRDVTPHNVMIRRDGSAVLVDFGVAKALGRFNTTEEGKIKGKLPYMAPEQLRGGKVSRRTDVYGAGAVLWEALVGRRLINAATEGEVVEEVLFGDPEKPSDAGAKSSDALDEVVLRALARDPADRFATAGEMAAALEAALTPARPSQVSAWLYARAAETLARQEAKLAAIDAMDLETSSVAVVTPTRVDERALEPKHATSGRGAVRLLPWLFAAGLGAIGALAWSRGSSSTATVQPSSVSSPAEPPGRELPPSAPAAASVPPLAAPAPSSAPSADASAPRPPTSTAGRGRPPVPPPSAAPKGCAPRRTGETGAVRKTVGADGTPTFVVLCPR